MANTSEHSYDEHTDVLSSVVPAYYNFSAPVYQDAALSVPFPVNSAGLYVVSADDANDFPIIHLDDRISYRVQIYSGAHELLDEEQEVDPSVETHFGSFSVVAMQ
jgi:hypothetical protein